MNPTATDTPLVMQSSKAVAGAHSGGAKIRPLHRSRRPGQLGHIRFRERSFRACAAASPTDECPVELKSERGVNYSTLCDLLARGEWEEADNEHRRLLCAIASDEAIERGWVYFTEVPGMPTADLDTLDKLWYHYSGGKFGFRVQKKIWIGCKRRWSPFFERIDWTTGENKAYRKWPEQFVWSMDAVRGHLPLTNALRGTQLLQAILDHPTFDDIGSMSAELAPPAPLKKPASAEKADSTPAPSVSSDATSKDSKPEDKPEKSSKGGKDSLDVDLSSFF